MTTNLKTLALLLSLAITGGHAIAADRDSTAPFDFSYRVAGNASLRPTLVFNDGRDTFIELDQDVQISTPGGALSFREGPYHVVRGIPNEIVLRNKREQVSITYDQPAKAPSAPGLAKLEKQPTAQDVPSLTREPKTAPQPNDNPAAPVASAAKSSAPEPVCAPKTLQSESALLVSFAPASTHLSAGAESRLLHESKTRDAQLQKVRIRMPEDVGLSALGKKRQQYLANLLAGTGIARPLIENEYGVTLGDSAEITFVNAVEKPCAKRPPVIRVNDGQLTVIAHEADATALLQEIGSALRLPVRLEGETHEIPVTVAVVAESPSSALARIGTAVGSKADIVLRDKELVLRFN